MKNRSQLIKNASWISIFGNAILSASKIFIGILTGSLAVVGDGIDSASDIVISIITLITAKIISKPPNVKFAYGYEKADSIASKVFSFFIFFAGAQLLFTTGKKLYMGNYTELPGKLAVYVTLFSIVGKLILTWYLHRVGKQVNSPMLISNAKNMKNDVIISLSVLLGLVMTFSFQLPILDPLAALLVSLWIMKSAFDIFMESNIELMDGVNDLSVYQKIFDASLEISGVNNPHRVRSRQIANTIMIVMDIEVDGSLSLHEAHKIAHEVEENIKQKVENVYDIVVHVEPIGDDPSKEKFGLSQGNVAL